MFVPGNNPGMMADAHIYGPDSIMLDLEDSVTMAEKDTARLLVHNALKSIDYVDTEIMVRQLATLVNNRITAPIRIQKAEVSPTEPGINPQNMSAVL